jgi:hypothetical protein
MDLALADRVHNNLMEVNSWMADASGGALHFENGELLFASRSPIPFLNGVMRERSTVEAGDLLRSARRFFFERDRGFIAFTLSHQVDLPKRGQSTDAGRSNGPIDVGLGGRAARFKQVGCERDKVAVEVRVDLTRLVERLDGKADAERAPDEREVGGR